MPAAAAADPLADAVARLFRDPDAAHLAAALAAMTPASRGSAPALALAGELARREGRLADAADLLARALATRSDLAPAWHALALTRVRQGDRDGARAAWRALLLQDSDDPVARYQIARTHDDDGNADEAMRGYEAQLARFPATLPAWYNLALLRLAAGDATGAIEALDALLARDASHVNGWIALGHARRRLGDDDAALAAFDRAIAIAPTRVEPLEASASLLAARAELPPAIERLARAIAIDPTRPSLHWASGSHLSALGEHAAAVGRMRAAHALDPADARGHSALLLALQYDASVAARADIAREHWSWGERHAAGFAPACNTAARRPGRLRIGYLSPRFGMGPLATLFLPVLEQHDRRRFEVRLYSAFPNDDAVAQRMRAACDGFRELPADDAAAAAAIADDDLDLLVDLAGHAPGHRLAVMARRPARVQATWLDYFETTGVPAIDYLIGDPIHTPTRDAGHFRERLVLLPCRFVHRPLEPVPATPPPALARGHATFGCFNRHAKINADVRRAWKALLDAVPDARLVLRASAYRGASTVAWLRERWAAEGLPVERIAFEPYLPWRDALAAYAEVDVALDPFPYNGGVTTCDALMRGVPVVALVGDRPIARQSAALLAAAGRPEWAVGTVDDYVTLGARLATDASQASRRAALHASVPGSPLCDVPAFTARLERAFVAMIDAGPRASSGTPPPPLPIE